MVVMEAGCGRILQTRR